MGGKSNAPARHSPGSSCVGIAFDDFEQARALLLAYGGAVEVLEPLALRLSIADYAEQIAQRDAD